MADKLAVKASGSAFIENLKIFSNDESAQTQEIDLVSKGAPVRLTYYESLLQDTIVATLVYIDTGNTVDDKTAVEGLPITGSESATLKFTDNNNETLELDMVVNKVTDIVDDSTKSMVQLDFVSCEFLDNDKIRLFTRVDGKVSDHVREILTSEEYLNTKKDVDIEETWGEHNKIFSNKKPFYMMNRLSTYSVPEGGEGKTAGYFLWETSEGFKFKSIDYLFDKEKNPKKKSIIYTETPDSGGKNIPEGYDVKALSFERDNRVNVKEKFEQGAFNTRIIMFNPFDCYYEVLTPNAEEIEEKGGYKTAGAKLPKINPKFNKTKANRNFSRTTFKYLDTGTLPSGKGIGKDQQGGGGQVGKSTTENFDVKNVLNQGIMRMNQLNIMKLTVTIPGDFSLHAGDSIFIDAPELKKDTKNDDVDKENGGLYIIRDLCHYITPKETYTKIILVRDSFGREGTARSG